MQRICGLNRRGSRRLAKTRALAVAICMASLAGGTDARASSENVGLGVAVGAAYSPTHVYKNNILEPVGNSFSWGFFADLPLTETFYISPAAMLYKLDLGAGAKPVTDIDLNFKFILPLGSLHLGPGVTVGLTSAEEKYHLHVGALAYVSYNLVTNMDIFVLAQYKRLFRDNIGLDDLHGYAGLMFRF
jgi:hypothetical protein